MSRKTGKLSVFEDGADFVWLRVAEDKSLAPVPDVPRFQSAAAARNWLKSPDAAPLAGMKIALIRFHTLADLVQEQHVRLTVQSKAKFRLEGQVEATKEA